MRMFKATSFLLVFVLSFTAAYEVESALVDDAVRIYPHTIIPLWPGIAPGSENATQREKTSVLGTGGLVVTRNVVRPTLTVYLPSKESNTGVGVIVAPGGGFRFLTMDAEGHDVARWLAARGIAAFVLKYRVVETPESDEELWSALRALFARPDRPLSLEQDAKHGIADAVQALKVVREHAQEWGLRKDAIGMVGFSAGAMVSAAAMLQAEPQDRPDFVGLIYGALFGKIPKMPENLPPVFMAYSSDDTLAIQSIEPFYSALRTAGHHAEVHIYHKGGHGFGMQRQGSSSDGWIEDFYRWLGSVGLTRAAGATSDAKR